MLIYA